MDIIQTTVSVHPLDHTVGRGVRNICSINIVIGVDVPPKDLAAGIRFVAAR
jgi:hypothetical protein